VSVDLLNTDEVVAPPTRVARLLRPVGRAVIRLRWRVHVLGTEHVPAHGPVLLASNHLGLLDGPLLLAVTPRMVHALVKREMFEGRGGAFFRWVGQIPLERDEVDPAAVKTAVRVLRDGGIVGVYPEGTRGSGDVMHTRLGLAYLAMVTGAHVVPVANIGTRPTGGHVGAIPARGSRVDVVFGPGIDVAARPWPRRRAAVEELAETLRVMLAGHVAYAVRRTGRSLPGPAPDEVVDAAGRKGPEVGPAVQEESR
jgi:1-acyl-sn-glycerol-3-phosphate acyltransferase